METAMSKEMVQMIESIGREKDLDPELIFQAVEEAMAFAAKKIVKGEPKISVEINRETGEPTVIRHWVIVDDVDLQENQDYQVLRPDAPDEFQRDNPAYQEGVSEYEEELQIDLGRQAAQLAKQAIYQRLRDIEQRIALEDVNERGEGLLYGTVKNFQKGNAILEIGRLEGVLPKSEMLPRDMLKIGSRVRVAIKSVEKIGTREVVTVSRASEEFMRLLIEQEVVQVEEGDIEIVKLVRAPGIRCKLIVKSHMGQDDRRGGASGGFRNDAARIIIGSKGMHAKNIAEETGGEHLDIITHSEELAEMVTQALQPAVPTRILINEENKVVEAAISDEHLGLVIGSKGVNIRLISELLGWSVEVMTEEQWDVKEQERLHKALEAFVRDLDVDEDVARALIEIGFSALDEVAYCDLSEIMAIEGFDEGVASEIQRRAVEWAEKRQSLLDVNFAPARESLLRVEGITEEEIEQLVRAEVFSSDDLADLATDELMELLPHWRQNRAQALIMSARKLWEEVAVES